jgi:hypothetical protein
VPQKVTSLASTISNEVSGGEVSRSGLVSFSVRSKRHVSKCNVDVIERLRERIRCIEGRSPVLDPIKPAIVQAPGQLAAVANGLFGDASHQTQGAHGTRLLCEQVPDQTGFPAARFADEDGSALPRSPHALPSSSFLKNEFSQSGASTQQNIMRQSQSDWTLGETPEDVQAGLSGESITQLSLDAAGVHEIKPVFDINSASRLAPGGAGDWAASWSAARAFALVMIARRISGLDAIDHKTIRQASGCPILWCMPRGAKAEHGALYGHGLRRFGLTPADVLMVETSSLQDTLWVLEEGLKSESLSMVFCMVDDVALTPARRLALAAHKHHTPCLLLTHPRMPPVGATATRWRVAAAASAPHPLSNCSSNGVHGDRLPPRFNGLGARRLALTLERYRAAPANVTGRETVVEWSDEAFCLRMVADVSDRSHAPSIASVSTAADAFRAG